MRILSIYIIFLLQTACFYVKGETVYENKNYKLSGENGVIASIIVKVDYSPEQDNYTLTIGNPGGIIDFDGKEKTLWFFDRTLQSKDFCKKNRNLSCKKFTAFLPFINNPEVDFSPLKEKRITAQDVLPFKVTALKQKEIDLELRIYVATLGKSETIEEMSFIKITFLPSGKGRQVQKGEGAGGGGAGAASPDGEKEKTPEEIEAARQDSIKQLVKKWNSYFTEKNKQAGLLIQSIDEIDSAAVTKEEIEDYENKVNQLKSTVEAQFQKRELLEENNLLTEKFVTFNSSCELAIKKLNEWKVELQKVPPLEKEINWMPFLVAGMGIMMAIPIITQIIGSRKVKKAEKKQREELRRQAEEQERARLLADEGNVI